MEKIKQLINSTELKGITDYFRLYRNIHRESKTRPIVCDKTIKISILSSFTINGIKEVLYVKCCEQGISSEFHVGNYNQYVQEILNHQSELYRFSPDFIIIFIDAFSIWGESYLSPYQISDEERKEQVNEKTEEIGALIEKIKENSSAKILLHNFEVPVYSPLGILENKQAFGFIEATEELNSRLRDIFKSDNQVFLFDYNLFCSKIGKRHLIDHKMYYIGDMKLDLKHFPHLADEYLSYIKPLMSITKKCLVLDLDNTLWGGVVGEDGLEGIKLGLTNEGKPFIEFQKYILSLFHRGVILAINSKNNINDVLPIFQKHPYMILKEEYFAAMQINWDDKISNMKAIAEELNLGLDSMVFIDDDKLNREMVRAAYPEVLVVELPDDPSLYLRTLMEINDFNTLQITEEDTKRGKIYAAQKGRKKIQKTTTDITDYLRKLETVLTIEKATPFTIPRISQLTQKTNQFNMTTRRYLEEDIKQFAESSSVHIISVKVEDKFGDNGITGVAIVKKGEEEWKIDTFLLSCRVLGRKVEEAIIAYIIEQAKKDNARTLSGEFISTKKNAPAKSFYKANGFNYKKMEKDNEIWVYELNKEYPFPDFIQIKRKN